jgi:ribose transport system substrate-binding protein
MLKRLILAAAAVAALSAPAMAQTYRFAIVPKAMNNPSSMSRRARRRSSRI